MSILLCIAKESQQSFTLFHMAFSKRRKKLHRNIKEENGYLGKSIRLTPIGNEIKVHKFSLFIGINWPVVLGRRQHSFLTSKFLIKVAHIFGNKKNEFMTFQIISKIFI
ncbi:hypothetical protein BpHYR1_039177 [Brachionus plicatilis]|uniref:Uncharacterized protein n=1 Tax=Brachionus plicatilis TaxID=10195 RepID=A0A3M7QP93_BRAPC|nr:hypothetical protein BpHYR1_039177 [Brachionus plicatilis]